METNFSFLESKKEYELFAGACIDAECILESSPVMSAVASRKALELGVKWVYSIDSALKPIGYREGLQSLLHNNGFPSLMDYTLWKRLQYIVRNGNQSVHTSKGLSKDDAILSLNILFDFVEWIDYCYGRDYEEREFAENKIPNKTKVAENIEERYKQVLKDVQKNTDKIVDEKDKEIARLLKANEELQQEMQKKKSQNLKTREYSYNPDMSEWTTRKRYIDADLKANGYVFDQTAKRNCVEEEYPVTGMPNATGTGYADYVIWGDTGKIIAVIEAKRASESADKGRNQGKLYADCIQNMQGSRPVIFYTNGFETYLWDDVTSAPRVVSGIFPQKDIDAMISRRTIVKPVSTIPINEDITNRLYQLRAVTKCCENYEKGIRKCLLVMATGTGKTRTAASVVDVMTRSQIMGRVLFLADRKELVKQAKNSFSSCLPDTTMCNLLVNKEEKNANMVFSTYPTMLNAIDNMKNSDGSRFFSPGHFSLIVIDEAHHSAANSYKKVLDYFQPKLWLGMTATPDKRDDNLEGRNIYEIFNHQIAYEIRLQDAMEEDLLCPFHYFGITDLDLIADGGKSSEERIENFRHLTSDERVENVMKQARYFGYSGERVKGLIFCSRIDEAKELSAKFNKNGWRTLVLSGNDSEEARAAAIERLAGKESENALDYIISVDIFSEGVDVPEINQVIMLRPTQSPIVFIQQLGRGLRKAEDKEYVVVLDFIGNYQNNFMIPIALSGDRSYNKDNIRRYVTEGGRIIPGASTIHFDEISRKRIFQAIDNANFSDIKLIRENYTNLKNKLGHIPALADFDKYGEMDVLRIFDNSSLGSYYKFLVKYEKEYTIRLSEDEEKVIEFISKKLASGKRVYELELLKYLMDCPNNPIGWLRELSLKKYHHFIDDNCAGNIINVMTNEFPTSAAKKTYAQCVFLEKEGDDYSASKSFMKMLDNSDFRSILEELLDFGITRYKENYSVHYQDTDLVLYQKYTYEDACRLLNWERNEVPLNIGGYKYDKKTKTFPIFINYDKQDDISDTTKYEDHFVSASRLIAISKSGRSVDSEDVQNFLKARERGIDVHLFVRKNKDDKISKEFYYLGRVIATGNKKEFIMPNTDKTAVEIEWALETPVREDIYEYIVNG